MKTTTRFQLLLIGAACLLFGVAATVRLSELATTSTINDADYFPVIHAGTNYTVTANALALNLATNTALAPHGLTVTPTIVSGSYTQTVNDGFILFGNAATRTNKLPSASLVSKPVTIVDAGKTALGTNLWITTTGGQLINGGPTQTNININGGTVTLRASSSGWWITSAFP